MATVKKEEIRERVREENRNKLGERGLFHESLLNLGVRSRNCLLGSNITSFAELRTLTADQLQERCPLMGRKSRNEVRDLLAQGGVPLREA